MAVVLLGLSVRTRTVGHGRLEVDHREVRARQERWHRGPECGRRVDSQAVAEVRAGGEVDVTPEGQGDRFAVAVPVRVERTADRDRRMMCRRRTVVGRPGGAGATPPAQRQQQRDDQDHGEGRGQPDLTVPAYSTRRGPGDGGRGRPDGRRAGLGSLEEVER